MNEILDITKEMEEIREKLGIMAFDAVTNYVGSVVQAMERVTKSRDKWRAKYFELKIKEEKNG